MLNRYIDFIITFDVKLTFIICELNRIEYYFISNKIGNNRLKQLFEYFIIL